MSWFHFIAFFLAAAVFSTPAARAEERTLVKSVRIDAPLAAVWAAWTTPAGLKAFLKIDAAIDLRVGGKYELYFGPPATAPQRGGEGCTVLSYVPQRMLSFNWNIPPAFPSLRALGPTTFIVLEFSPHDDNSTDLRFTHLGWQEGEAWDAAYVYFNQTWTILLRTLQQSFTQASPPTTAPPPASPPTAPPPAAR